nr:serine/threonine-protein kinase [Pseudenhygromyxa sp. WMMC2535]
MATAVIVEPRESEGARAHLGLGQCIGRYVVLEELGTGAMGEVYSAYDPELDRRVAVKLLRRRSSRGAKSLIREAQAMAKLAHPNVVAVHDVGTLDADEGEPARLFIAMEYVEGGTLREWWQARARGWEEIVAVFVEAGRGLAAAHAKKLVHRDFKPDNVLVGADGRVKVTDFGLARSAGELASDLAGDSGESGASGRGEGSADSSHAEPETLDGNPVALVETGSGSRQRPGLEAEDEGADEGGSASDSKGSQGSRGSRNSRGLRSSGGSSRGSRGSRSSLGSRGSRGSRRSRSESALKSAEPTGSFALLPKSRWYGTPAYMAPEQFTGGVVDHLTDQFSFCVGLFEALYGSRPFPGTKARQVAEQVCRGARISPPEVGVPKRVLEVIERGLSIQREDRFASMDELLLALEPPAATRRRSTLIVGASAAVVAVAAVLFGAGVGEREQPPDACARADAAVVETWSPQRRLDLEEQIVATEVPGAADTAKRVVATFDIYARQLSEALVGNCHEHTKDPGLADLYQRRSQCLARRLGALEAQLGAFTPVDATRIQNLVTAAAGLPAVGDCSDLEQLAARFEPPPPAIANAVASSARRLDRVDALYRESAFEAARALLEPSLPGILALGHDPLTARAQLLEGRLADAEHDYELAHEALYQAYLAGLASNDDALAVDALAVMVRVVGVHLGDFDAARRWAEQAHALGERLDRHVALARLGNFEAQVAYRSGDLERAVELSAAALELYRDLFGDDNVEVGKAEGNLAALLLAADRLEESLPHHRRALAIAEAELGPLHGSSVTMQLNYASTLMHLGRDEDAREQFELGLARLAARGEDSDESLQAMLLNGLGELDARAQDWKGANHRFAHMHEIFLRLYGPEHGYTLNATTSLAASKARLGRANEAVEMLEQTLRVSERQEMPAVEVATTRAELAIALWIRNHTNDRTVASALLADALAAFAEDGREVSPVLATWMAEHPGMLVRMEHH